VSEHRDFKFSAQVDHSKLQPIEDKLSLEVAWSCHVSTPEISLERLNLKTSSFVHWLAMWSISLRIDKWVWSRSRELCKFWEIIDNISEKVQDKDIDESYNGRLIGNHVW